jgi:hypothetical protein
LSQGVGFAALLLLPLPLLPLLSLSLSQVAMSGLELWVDEE